MKEQNLHHNYKHICNECITDLTNCQYRPINQLVTKCAHFNDKKKYGIFHSYSTVQHCKPAKICGQW